MGNICGSKSSSSTLENKAIKPHRKYLNSSEQKEGDYVIDNIDCQTLTRRFKEFENLKPEEKDIESNRNVILGLYTVDMKSL